MELNINITIDLSQSVKSLLQGFNLSNVACVQVPRMLVADECIKEEVKAPVDSAPVKVKEEPVKEEPIKETATEKPDAEVKQDAPGISDVELRREPIAE